MPDTDPPSGGQPDDGTHKPDANQSGEGGTGEAPGDDGKTDDGKPKKKGLSRRAKIILLVIAVVVVVGAVIWFVEYETRGKYLQNTNDAQIAVDLTVVAPKVAGYVDQVLVTDNQDVRAGQPLVRIDPRDSRAKAAQAGAQIAAGNAQADQARAGVREQYAAIAQAEAELAAARAQAAYDAAEVVRYRPLAASGAETREKLANLESTARQSAQAARAKAAALVTQKRHVASIAAQVQQGVAQADEARAQLASAEVDLHSTLIRAAINGRVGDKTVAVGQYAQAGTRLMSLVPLDKLYITANFKETQLGLMRPGQPATITVDSLSGVELRGRVESVSPGTGAQFSLLPPENATGNFTKITQRVPVRISIEATPDVWRLLVPGLSVVVTVDTIGAKDDMKRVRERQEQYDKQLKERREQQARVRS